MRVSMSAMGSVMLISSHRLSPARLHDARDLPAHRVLANLVAAEAELAEHSARAACDRAAVAQPRRVRVARQLLELQPRRVAVFVGHARVADDAFERSALLRVLRDELHALLLPIDQCQFRHGGPLAPEREPDRKSTRLNSSHVEISYAVFCLKKKKEEDHRRG